MTDTFDVLLLCKDLFFTSQLQGACQRAGLRGRTCLSQAGCETELQSPSVKWVVIDIELPELDLSKLREVAQSEQQLIAFGPHMRVDLLSAAQEAGCNYVISRGQAASQLESLLRGD